MYLPPVCRSYKVWVGCRQHHLLSLSYLSLKSTKLHCIADKSATYFFSHLHHRNTSTATSHSNVPFTMYSMGEYSNLVDPLSIEDLTSQLDLAMKTLQCQSTPTQTPNTCN